MAKILGMTLVYQLMCGSDGRREAVVILMPKAAGQLLQLWGSQER